MPPAERAPHGAPVSGALEARPPSSVEPPKHPPKPSVSSRTSEPSSAAPRRDVRRALTAPSPRRPALAARLEHDRDKRQRDDHRDDRQKVVVDAGDRVPEDEAGENDAEG